jgi:N-acetylglucosamine-6-phosphate deacetylase
MPDGALQPAALRLERQRLSEVLAAATATDARPDAPVIDAGDCLVSPGFIDLHVNGGGGASFQTATDKAITTALAAHVRGGTAGLLAALNTVAPGQREPALSGLRHWLDQQPHPTPLLGVYLEGPYYHPQERGAHPEELLRDPDPAEYLPWLRDYGGLVKVLSCAPELPRGLELIRACVEHGVVPAAGHSAANEAQIAAAIDAGLQLVTHLYCAQSTFHRDPGGAAKHLGLAETALLRDELTVEIIPDGKHLPPVITELILKSKSPDQVCVTTDAMLAAGMEPGRYEFLGTEVLVEDGVAWRPDKQRYAGSVLTMDAAVRHLVREVGVPVESALRMASTTPAGVLGLADRKGALKAGMDADLTILTPDLHCAATIVAGRVLFLDPDAPLGLSGPHGGAEWETFGAPSGPVD